MYMSVCKQVNVCLFVTFYTWINHQSNLTYPMKLSVANDTWIGKRAHTYEHAHRPYNTTKRSIIAPENMGFKYERATSIVVCVCVFDKTIIILCVLTLTDWYGLPCVQHEFDVSWFSDWATIVTITSRRWRIYHWRAA